MKLYKLLNLLNLIHAWPIAIVLIITGYRFGKSHRTDEDLMYRLLNSTMANIIAYQITGK